MFHSEALAPGFKHGADIGEIDRYPHLVVDYYSYSIDRYPHLIVVGYYSFAIFKCPLPSLAANSVITAFKIIFSDTGVPMTLITDNGTCFVNQDFTKFAKNRNFTHVTS